MKLSSFGAYNDGKYPASAMGSKVKSYRHWYQMLRRVYEKGTHKNYDDATVCKDFLSYSTFHEWCLTKVGYEQDDFHLDKDFKVKGCKVYSPDTCIFIPKELNQVIVNRADYRGEYPLGVYAYQDGYRCQVLKFGKRKTWFFSTVEEAFLKYKLEKELHIKDVLNKYQHLMDCDTVEACMSYVVEITD